MSDTRISEKALRAFMERAYEKEGFEAEEARQIADVLMQADLFGIESHGAQRMMYYHQNIKKRERRCARAGGGSARNAGFRADGRPFRDGAPDGGEGDAHGH